MTPYIGKAYPTHKGNMYSTGQWGSYVTNPYDDAASAGRWLYATEVTSMALENMYANPLMLARQDPRLFDWVFETVMR